MPGNNTSIDGPIRRLSVNAAAGCVRFCVSYVRMHMYVRARIDSAASKIGGPNSTFLFFPSYQN